MANSESTGNSESQEMRNKVQQWLMEEGWQVGLRSLPDTLWALVCEDFGKRHLTVVQETGGKDRIIMAAGLSINPDHQQRYTQMPENKRRNLIFELRQAIIQLDVGYDGIGEPFQLIVFSNRIYYDGLTKDAFLQRVTKVRNATILARNIIACHLAEPPPPTEEQHIGFQLPH